MEVPKVTKQVVEGFVILVEDVLKQAPDLFPRALKAYADYSSGNVVGLAADAAEAIPKLQEIAKDVQGVFAPEVKP